jgi:hypothetical protein
MKRIDPVGRMGCRGVRRTTAFVVTVFIALLGLVDASTAQQYQSLRLEGTIHAVNCGAQQLTVEGSGGLTVLQGTRGTAVRVNGVSVPLCSLQQFVGAPAGILVTVSGGQFIAARVDVNGPVPFAVPPPPAAYPPVVVPPPAVVVPPPPIVGVVLGTILVGGLPYLLVQGPYGYFYHYPYYGPYYHYYYRPYYGPYAGPYLYSPAYRYAPYGWCPHPIGPYWCR